MKALAALAMRRGSDDNICMLCLDLGAYARGDLGAAGDDQAAAAAKRQRVAAAGNAAGAGAGADALQCS